MIEKNLINSFSGFYQAKEIKSKVVWLLTSQVASTLLQELGVRFGTLHCSGAPDVVEAWHKSERGPHCRGKKSQQ